MLNPYPDIHPDHPLIVRERRRLRWLTQSPERYSIKVIVRIVIIVAVLYAGWVALRWLDISPIPLSRSFFFGVSTDFLIILAGLSLLATVLLDYASITASLNVISGEINSGTWDLLRLTAAREGELVLAKHAVAQLRAWRTMLRVIGLRIAAVLTAVFIVIREYTFATPYLTVQESITFFLFNLAPFAALSGVFILEPLWRMRAMTALGMVISARVQDAASASLVAIGMVLALWFIQALVVVAVIGGLSVLFLMLSAFGTSALCAPFTVLLAIYPTVYGFYSVLKMWGLRHVARRLFSLTG